MFLGRVAVRMKRGALEIYSLLLQQPPFLVLIKREARSDIRCKFFQVPEKYWLQGCGIVILL